MEAAQKQNCDKYNKTDVSIDTVAEQLSEMNGSIVTRSKDQSGPRSTSKIMSSRAAKGKLVRNDMTPKVTIAQVSNGNSLIIEGFINGLSCNFVVDTGACVTIVSSELLQHQILWEKFVPCDQLETATGGPIQTFGKINMKLKIGNRTYCQWVTVADIIDDCLLGIDFLKDKKCIINVAEKTLRFPDQGVFQRGSYITIAKVRNGNSLIVEGFINSLSCNFVVDTGACVTIVSSELLRHQIQTEKCSPGDPIRTANGKSIDVSVCTDAELKIGNRSCCQRVTVAQITDDCLLGIDFLKFHKCIIDFNEGVIAVPVQEI